MMKRLVISAFVMALAAVSVSAKPARPVTSLYRHPDGSTVSIRLYGDEFGHYATDASGRVLELDANGFYRISASGRPARRSSFRRRTRNRGPYMSTGERHIPVLLVEFADVRFSFDNVRDMFDALLNEEGYSYDGATGSVRDYYLENSHGAFVPVFDIMTPVTLEKNMAAYGGNVGGQDKAPELALYEACLKLDDEVDFSAYDQDQDGQIDMILFYFAGYDEAEYGPAEAIWSHQWNVQESDNTTVNSALFDGLRLGRYFCTSELSGNTGAKFTGIGTTCHEFAHSIGLPDMYDTDGTDNGYAGGMYTFSPMGYGVYNNDARTPPYFSVLERQMLGWYQGEIPELPEGNITIGPVHQDVAYRTPAADNEGEYFIWEVRDGTGWDSPIPAGLLLYHIDQSSNIVDSKNSYTASFLWEDWEDTNIINAYGSHPCAYLIPSSAPSSLNFMGNDSAIVYPGTSNVVFVDQEDWSKSGTQFKVADIRHADGGIRINVMKGHASALAGKVTSNDGTPASGLLVEADISEQLTLTDQEGHFVLDLPDGTVNMPFRLAVSGEGFRKAYVTGVMDGRSVYMPVSIMKTGESALTEISKWDRSDQRIFFPFPVKDYGDCMGAVLFTADDLFPFAGRRLEEVSFYNHISDNGAEAVYVIVDFGDRRVLTREVPEPLYGLQKLNEIDISDADLRIPEFTDVYIGYGVKGSDYSFPLAVTRSGQQGNSFYGHLNMDGSVWEPMFTEKTGGYMDLMLSAGVREVLDPEDIAQMGFASIDLGDKNWKAGETLPLVLKPGPLEPLTVTWLFDGEIALDGSVLLTKGVHTVKAVIKYSAGRSENLKAIISCE